MNGLCTKSDCRCSGSRRDMPKRETTEDCVAPGVRIDVSSAAMRSPSHRAAWRQDGDQFFGVLGLPLPFVDAGGADRRADGLDVLQSCGNLCRHIAFDTPDIVPCHRRVGQGAPSDPG